jgi:putative ABC transport system permease protein
VALLPLAAGGVFESNRFANRASAIGAEHFLIAGFEMDHQEHGLDPEVAAARTRAAYEALEERLAAEPGVEHTTFADRLPVEDQFKYSFEVHESAGAPPEALRTSTGVNVGPGFFETFETSVVAGRAFSAGDHERGGVVVVNEAFVRHVFADRNPIGHRIRVTGGDGSELPNEAWYEIVGIVRNFGWTLDVPQEQAAMYYPRLATGEAPINMVIQVRDPEALAPRLRAIAADLNPMVTLRDVQPLASAGGSEARLNWTLTSVAWFVGAIVLLLSATGIHALMAFTVARRTREIGIRAALGARPHRLMARIFSRAFLQIGLGVLVGSGLVSLQGLDSARQVAILLATIGVMVAAGLLACVVPLRRALRIHPTEALRAES